MLDLKPLAEAAPEVDFGADAGYLDLDLDHLDDATFAALERAVLTHAVVVVRGQGSLSPRAQFELTQPLQSAGPGLRPRQRLEHHEAERADAGPGVDPRVAAGEAARQRARTRSRGDSRRRAAPPVAPVVPPDAAHRRAGGGGFTRFYRWHMDAALYELHPPRVTTLLALKVPEARRETVVYDDGSGDKLEVQLGTTAFVSGEKAFALLSPAQRVGLKTKARYAPHPYVWMRNARARSNGLGLHSEGRELRAPSCRRTRGEDHDAAAGLEEPADRQAVAAAARLLRRGSDRRRKAHRRPRDLRRLLSELMRPAIAPRASTPTPGAPAISSSSTTAPSGTASSARCARPTCACITSATSPRAKRRRASVGSRRRPGQPPGSRRSRQAGSSLGSATAGNGLPSAANPQPYAAATKGTPAARAASQSAG